MIDTDKALILCALLLVGIAGVLLGFVMAGLMLSSGHYIQGACAVFSMVLGAYCVRTSMKWMWE